MSRKIKNITKDFLAAVPLPNHADTYTTISHDSIIQYAYTELANHGFGIVSEEYRCTHDGQIAQGIYKIHYNKDPELSLMFGWANSYNKQMRFKCTTGAYINTNGTVMIAGEMGTYSRKHTGTADTDTIQSMKDQITNAFMYYDQLVLDKDAMKAVELSTRRQAELLGLLFAEYEILTTEQASFVRQQMEKPSHFYNGGKHTLWSFYNHVTLALQQSHPRTWMEDQRMLHHVITNEFSLNAPAPVVSAPVMGFSEPVEITAPIPDPLYIVPNQTNILDQIAEVEVTEEPTFNWPDPSSDTLSETVQYTDPQGNTFEAPVVESFTDLLEEQMVEQVEEDNQIVHDMIWGGETKVVSLEPTPEDYVAFEKEERELHAIDLKEESDFDFEFNLDDDEEEADNLFL